MNRQLQSGVWVASYLSMSPFPLIGRVVHRQKHLTVEREKWDVTFVFTPEMWSLTRLSKPNTSLDLNKTLGSWSSSSPRVIWVVSVSGVWWWWVVRRCHVVITSAIKLNWGTLFQMKMWQVSTNLWQSVTSKMGREAELIEAARGGNYPQVINLILLLVDLFSSKIFSGWADPEHEAEKGWALCKFAASPGRDLQPGLARLHSSPLRGAGRPQGGGAAAAQLRGLLQQRGRGRVLAPPPGLVGGPRRPRKVNREHDNDDLRTSNNVLFPEFFSRQGRVSRMWISLTVTRRRRYTAPPSTATSSASSSCWTPGRSPTSRTSGRRRPWTTRLSTDARWHRHNIVI